MPELPEVETTLRGIAPFLEGGTIEDIVVRNPSLRWPVPRETSRAVGRDVAACSRRRRALRLLAAPRRRRGRWLGTGLAMAAVPGCSDDRTHFRCRSPDPRCHAAL